MEKDILSKITQGRWETTIIGNIVYIVSGHEEIAIICVKPDARHLYKPARMEANAKLIVHAPQTLRQRNDLLELLKDILEWDEILPHSKTRIRDAIAEVEYSK